MAKFTCKNDECSMFDIEKTEPVTTRKYNKDTEEMETKEAVCPVCGMIRTETTEFKGMCANLASFSMMSKEKKTEYMQKRSADHTKRTITDHMPDINQEKGFAQ